MNGIHDMVHALSQAIRSGGNLRPYIERIPAAEYLRMSYYERRYTALVTRLIERGVVTRAEVESGRVDPAAVKATPALTPAVARELLFRTSRTEQHIELTPRFRVGDRVRGRNIHPTTHTRMPRYTRGRTGVAWSASVASSICLTGSTCRPHPSPSMSI
jgi:nitrile hydratase